MKLAELLEEEIDCDKYRATLAVETSYIISIWEVGENTMISIDGPPYEAEVLMPYNQLVKCLATAKVRFLIENR